MHVEIFVKIVLSFKKKKIKSYIYSRVMDLMIEINLIAYVEIKHFLIAIIFLIL